MSRTRLAVDGDQVLFDFDTAWRTTAEALLGRTLQPCGQSYHLMARYQLSMSEYHRCWAEFHRRKIWRDCPVFPEALATVRAWLDAGHEVFVVSAVDVEARKLRQQALDALGLQKVRLIGVGSKGSKYQTLKILKPDLFADDLWKHCREAVDAGVRHVVRVSGGHDGGGDPVRGVKVVRGIEEIAL